jgi:hypothetical protein
MNNFLKTLSVICFCYLQMTVYAQVDTDGYNTVQHSTTNLKKEAVNMYVMPGNGLLINYDQPSGIPKYFQFSANSNANTSLTVQLTVADNNNMQTITRDIEIQDHAAYYEIPIHQYLTASLAASPDAVIRSVTFTNNSNGKVMVRETMYSSSSVKYPVGINQVFVMDMAGINKRYYIHSNYERLVNINIYESSGVLLAREKITLNVGENFIDLEMLRSLSPDKYVIVVSDATNTNIANTMTVMY